MEEKICPLCQSKFTFKEWKQKITGRGNYQWNKKKYCSRKCHDVSSNERRRERKSII